MGSSRIIMSPILKAVISQNNEMIALQTPYNRDFVNDLKAEIHYTERQWDATNKYWWVVKAQENKALEIAARYFEIIDGRNKSVDEIEDAQIEGEIAQIIANQEEILKNKEYIQEIIERLSQAINRYSYGSKSAIKYALAKDRALLDHSLSNACIPVEQLTELQVRGMVAALRLIDGGYNAPKGSHL
jgi:hypothetical protein